MDDHDQIDLGPCCACGKEDKTVRNVFMLRKKAPIPGTGWACLICNLPQDGAVAVLCDACTKAKTHPRFAILGYASMKQRIPIEKLTEPFEHDIEKHEEFQRRGGGDLYLRRN